MNIKAIFKNRWFVLGSIAVLATVIITSAVFIFSNDGGMRVQKVDYPDSVRKASDFSASRLYIHPHGTFTIRIVYKNTVEWVGVGTWKKSGKKYIFTYVDVYSNGAGEMQRSTRALDIQNNPEDVAYDPNFFTYRIKNGRVIVHDVNNRIYQFS